MTEKFNIWEGIFSSFKEAELVGSGAGFSGDVYLHRTSEYMKICIEALALGKPIPIMYKERSTMLPLVVSMLIDKDRVLEVLDFGGGTGIGYLTLLESIPGAANKIDYTIVELPAVCEEGRKLLPQVTFTEFFPKKHDYKLIYSSSAIQYISDWECVTENIAAYGANFILFSDLFAGENPAFVTLQNYYGNKICHWFFNSRDFIGKFYDLGYDLVMNAPSSYRRLNVDSVLPMSNFPLNYQMSHTLNVLFLKR